ncbi:MAG: DNA integrity scanning protein DisA nucleotide-binding domain protein [Candidatus Omnitrophica bacterium]|nr:DNA integrity scanning protein DisA nucleotide-binding domain protein [Candidatus Omnitrophota bacterium]
MNTTILFLLSCYILLIALFILRRHHLSIRESLAFFFALIFYTVLLYITFRWQRPPPDIEWILWVLFGAGVLVAIIETFFGLYHRFVIRRRNLKLLKMKQGPLYELVLACKVLASRKLGALIVLERKTRLQKWMEKGIMLDAVLTPELLHGIFTPPGDLHDGAVIIHKGKVASAGVILPLTQSDLGRKDLGTRHRAALGMSEATDALCLIVSEETGAVSLADRGQLHYGVPLLELPKYLYQSLRFKLKKPKQKHKK